MARLLRLQQRPESVPAVLALAAECSLTLQATSVVLSSLMA